jgi:hypothetical protein
MNRAHSVGFLVLVLFFLALGCELGVNRVKDMSAIRDWFLSSTAFRDLRSGFYTAAGTLRSGPGRFGVKFPLFQSAYYYYWF